MPRRSDPCLLTAVEAERRVRALSDWQVHGKVLLRHCRLPSRQASVAFVAFLVELGTSLGSEPLILAHGREVTVRLASERGLTERDFLLAEAIEGVSPETPSRP